MKGFVQGKYIKNITDCGGNEYVMRVILLMRKSGLNEMYPYFQFNLINKAQ